MKWVVPIITAPTRSPGMSASASARRRLSTTPEVTSSVVGDFTADRIRPPSITTASVFVPPTSTPMRIMPHPSSYAPP